jgi:hypothetical protein
VSIRANLTGQRFGRWSVIGFSHIGKFDRSYWSCRCDCGTERVVVAQRLKEGGSKSCGCLAREVTVALKTTHGHNRVSKRTSEYNSWVGMINRCTNPKHRSFKEYGGRGIKVCKRWRRSFAAFLEDMGPRPTPQHTIDRKNNDGGYTKRNCRWATRSQQNLNRRK